MKKNKMMRIASVLLVAVLLSTCAISGTFAKYVTEYTASTKAIVAKWDVTVESVKSGSTEEEFNFDIFKTIYDTVDPANKAADGQVEATMIAPGTWGYFDIELSNDSDVDATYTVEFTETIKTGVDFTSPIKYKVEVVAAGAEVVLPTSGLGLISAGNAADVAFNRGADVTIRVYWVWEFGDSANNVNDTKIGVAAQTDAENLIKAGATITVEQVD